MTHQYEAKEKNLVQKKGNNPKVNMSVLVSIFLMLSAEVRTVPRV